MTKQDKRPRDTFTLSLGGMTAISSFVAAPAIAHDRLRQVPKERERKRYIWAPRLFRVT